LNNQTDFDSAILSSLEPMVGTEIENLRPAVGRLAFGKAPPDRGAGL